MKLIVEVTGDRRALRSSVTINTTRLNANVQESQPSSPTITQSRIDDTPEKQPTLSASPPKPRAAHPDDDLSFSASEHESGIELPDKDKIVPTQYEGEIRWMPKGDPKHLMVKAKPENFSIEMGEELNFFDTFAPQNLEVLEADNYEDYKKYFCDKGTNFFFKK